MLGHNRAGSVCIFLTAVGRSADLHPMPRAGVKLMISCAGPIGEWLHDGNEYAGLGDGRMIDALRRRFGVSDARMKRMERRTQRLLLDHLR